MICDECSNVVVRLETFTFLEIDLHGKVEASLLSGKIVQRGLGYPLRLGFWGSCNRKWCNALIFGPTLESLPGADLGT